MISHLPFLCGLERWWRHEAQNLWLNTEIKALVKNFLCSRTK